MKCFKTITIALSLLAATGASAQMTNMNAQDLTATFEARFQTPPELSVEKLRSYKIVMASGLKNPLLGRVSGDFADQIALLKEIGLLQNRDFVFLSTRDKFNGLQSAKENAESIATAIRNSDRPVLLISQSKASIDALEALLNNPDLVPKVHAWFSIQGAFGGAAAADEIESRPTDRAIFHRVISWLGGNPECLIELQRSKRAAAMAARSSEISALTVQLKIISLATSQEFDKIYWPLQKLDHKYFPDYDKVENDGVVQVQDALLPNTPFIKAKGIDHADATMREGKYDRKAFTRAVLSFMVD
jgi:hypothetical protein